MQRSSLRTAAGILGGTLTASAVGGIAWGILAPTEHLLVVSADRGVALTSESRHQFDAVGLLACASLIVGILVGSAAWSDRRSRGPLMVGALLIATVTGSGVMAIAGLGVASLRFPAADTSTVGEIVAIAPGIGTPLVLVFQPLAACMVMLALAALNPYDDLGVADVVEEPLHDEPNEAELPSDARGGVRVPEGSPSLW